MTSENIIKSTVAQILPHSRIILFGSRARGDDHRDSDYDLLVVIDEKLSPVDKMPYRTNIRKQLLSQNIFSDILIQSESEIQEKKELPGHIIKSILEEGIEL